jgi:hypothetical protein
MKGVVKDKTTPNQGGEVFSGSDSQPTVDPGSQVSLAADPPPLPKISELESACHVHDHPERNVNAPVISAADPGSDTFQRLRKHVGCFANHGPIGDLEPIALFGRARGPRV